MTPRTEQEYAIAKFIAPLVERVTELERRVTELCVPKRNCTPYPPGLETASHYDGGVAVVAASAVTEEFYGGD